MRREITSRASRKASLETPLTPRLIATRFRRQRLRSRAMLLTVSVSWSLGRAAAPSPKRVLRRVRSRLEVAAQAQMLGAH